LLENQQYVLLGLLEQLGGCSKVFYILAARPEVTYKAALRDCVKHCANRQEVLMELRYWAGDRWKITGPATKNNIIVLSTPTDNIITNVWDIADWDKITDWV
jgi:hypothetical protein